MPCIYTQSYVHILCRYIPSTLPNCLAHILSNIAVVCPTSMRHNRIFFLLRFKLFPRNIEYIFVLYYSLGSREAFGTLPYCCARLYRIRLKLMHLCNYYKPSAKFDQAKCHFIYRSQFKLHATFCAVF